MERSRKRLAGDPGRCPDARRIRAMIVLKPEGSSYDERFLVLRYLLVE